MEDAGRPLANPNFEQTTNGQPSDWSDLGDALLWQEHGSEISNANGGTGMTFSAFEGMGSLKLWGDYGADPYGRGESSVYQQFLSTDQWAPANHVFWIDAWAMIHDTDPLQNGQSSVSEFVASMIMLEPVPLSLNHSVRLSPQPAPPIFGCDFGHRLNVHPVPQ